MGWHSVKGAWLEHAHYFFFFYLNSYFIIYSAWTILMYKMMYKCCLMAQHEQPNGDVNNKCTVWSHIFPIQLPWHCNTKTILISSQSVCVCVCWLFTCSNQLKSALWDNVVFVTWYIDLDLQDSRFKMRARWRSCFPPTYGANVSSIRQLPSYSC